MGKRQQIYFDDILESLWSQAYGEIVSIVKEQHLVGQTISITSIDPSVSGIFVDDNGALHFLDKYQTLRMAEDFSDSTMFEVYKTLFRLYGEMPEGNL